MSKRDREYKSKARNEAIKAHKKTDRIAEIVLGRRECKKYDDGIRRGRLVAVVDYKA